MPETVTRFAPSPTGYLHLGHAHSALFAARAASADGGRFLLRIEDIDLTRCRPAFEAAIYEDLAWLGLAWERPVRRQSEHFADYAAALARLEGEGLLYPCFCTRRQIAAEIARSPSAPQGPDGPLYPGTCRRLTAAARRHRMAAEPFAWRLDVGKALRRVAPADLTWVERGEGPQTARPSRYGDAVLGRKETPASYHLAVTVDDALQGVTLVTRGQDLRPASDLHRLLQALLGLPTPDYMHHRLLVDRAGQRLAKRAGARSLRDLREAGAGPAEVRRLVGMA